MVLGCSADTPEDNKAWSDKFNFPFPLLTDEYRSLPETYGGVKRWAVLIDTDRRIKQFWPEIEDKAGFGAEALAAVAATDPFYEEKAKKAAE